MDGVVDCEGLSPSRVIRMQLFGLVEKWKREVTLEKKYTVLTTNSMENKNYSPLVCLASLEEMLNKIFMLIDLQEQVIPDFRDALGAAKRFCESYYSLWADKPDRRQRADEARFMRELLELLEMVNANYWLFMPLLQRGIRVVPGEQQKEKYDHRAQQWLQNFQSVLSNQSTAALVLIKGILKKEASKTKVKTIILKAEEQLRAFSLALEATIRDTSLAACQLQGFTRLPTQEQHVQISQLNRILGIHEQAMRQFQESRVFYNACMHEINNLHASITGKWKEGIENREWVKTTINSGMRSTWHYLQALLSALLADVGSGSERFIEIHDVFESELPSKYSSLGHVKPVDMLEWKLSTSCLDICDRDLGLSEEIKQKLKGIHEQMLLLMEEIRRHSLPDPNNDFDLQGNLVVFKESLDAVHKLTEGKVKEVDALLVQYSNTALCIERICLSGRGWELFFRNPLASVKEEKGLEQLFFCDLAMLLRRRLVNKELLQPLREIEAHVSQVQNPAIVQQVSNLACQLSRRISAAQRAIQNRAEVVPDNFMKETRFLWEKVVQCGTEIEERVQQLEFLLPSSNEDPALKKLSALLSRLKSSYQRDFFSLGQSLLQKYQEWEWVEAEEKNRLLREEKKLRRLAGRMETPRIIRTPASDEAIPLQPEQKPEVLPVPVPAHDDTIEGSFLAFEKICRELAPLCQSFVQTSADQEQVLRTRLQHESATNLLESLPVVRELANGLKKHGNSSFFAHLLHVKLAVLLEQAGILTASILNIYRAPDELGHALFFNNGRECFWERHSPYQLAKTVATHWLRDKRQSLLNKAQFSLLQGYDRTIAITSRKPSSGGDALTDLLQILDDEETDGVQREQCLQGLEQTYKHSLEIVLTLLKPVYQPSQAKTSALSHDAIKACCAPLPPNEEFLKEEAKTALDRMNERLKRLQQRLAIPNQRRVPPLGRKDPSMAKRIGTIWSSLNDLGASLRLCGKLLLEAEDPTLCLVTAESGLLQQASMLEGVFLSFSLTCLANPAPLTSTFCGRKGRI